jgi:hypothetical protein
MTGWKKRLFRVAASGVVACGSVLACFWPTETQADDAESAVAAQKDIGRNTTRIGKILATTHLVHDENAKSKWFIEIEVQNTNPEGRETAELQEEVMRTTYQSMGRTMSASSTVAWRGREKVDVMPGEKLVLRHELPALLASQLTAAVRPPADQANAPVMVQRANYEVAITDSTRPQGQTAQARGRVRAPALASRPFNPNLL